MYPEEGILEHGDLDGGSGSSFRFPYRYEGRSVEHLNLSGPPGLSL